jgi:hypothetical protein
MVAKTGAGMKRYPKSPRTLLMKARQKPIADPPDRIQNEKLI